MLDEPAMLWRNEALLHRQVEMTNHVSVIPENIEQADMLHEPVLVTTELRPSRILDELVDRTQTTRKHQRRARQIGHHALTLMHVINVVNLGEPLVIDLLPLFEPRDHTDNLPAGLKRGGRHRSHESDGRPSVNDTITATCQRPTNNGRRSHVAPMVASSGTAIHSDVWHNLSPVLFRFDPLA